MSRMKIKIRILTTMWLLCLLACEEPVHEDKRYLADKSDKDNEFYGTLENLGEIEIPIEDGDKELENVAQCPDSESIESCLRAPGNKIKRSKQKAKPVDDKLIKQGDLSKLGTYTTRPTYSPLLYTSMDVTKHIGLLSKKKSAYAKAFNDLYWFLQWYAQDYRTELEPVMDHNLVPVYRLGITGQNIKIAVVDDGVAKHPDLVGNLDEANSYDFDRNIPGSHPDLNSWRTDYNEHGTNCAGVIAMAANNSRCGIGVAFNSKIVGIKTGGLGTNEYMEARAIAYGIDKVDIFSCSWGPTDDGMTIDTRSNMLEITIIDGVTKGRNKKGILFVFAAGNGGTQEDHCAADILVNNVNIIAITAATQEGKITDYAERCCAIHATAYSAPLDGKERTVTVHPNGGCSTLFLGTSAATPLAAGIFALVLQANPDLTYRDMMHLIAMGSEVAPLADNGDIWYRNAAGFWVSNYFGFGLLNAENMVMLATKQWKTVPEHRKCTVPLTLEDPQILYVGADVVNTFFINNCANTQNEVRYLEEVEVVPTIFHNYRGSISITIKSSAGTAVKVLEPRPRDTNSEGITGRSIKSLHYWGEYPVGHWTFEVKVNFKKYGFWAIYDYIFEMFKQPKLCPQPTIGCLYGFVLHFHGTFKRPDHYQHLPREYAGFRLTNGLTQESGTDNLDYWIKRLIIKRKIGQRIAQHS